MKKPYEKPAVVHTEKLEVRAVSCLKQDPSTNSACSGGIVS
jgi:hypothetical protein